MTHDELTALEAASIRSFVENAAEDRYLIGRVLDYGCGKQPYRDIIEGIGSLYRGYDDPTLPGFAGDKHEWPDWDPQSDYDSVLCTQVIQYVPDPREFVKMLRWFVSEHSGYLVLTYPTTWPEIRDDLWRFTALGMNRLLRDAGFSPKMHVKRAAIKHEGFELALGYGVIAQA